MFPDEKRLDKLEHIGVGQRVLVQRRNFRGGSGQLAGSITLHFHKLLCLSKMQSEF